MFVPNTSASSDLPLVETTNQSPPKTVFLYDQRNQGYLDGRAKHPYLRESGGSTLKQILVVLLIGFMALLIYASVTNLLRWILINTAGTPTLASVTELTKTRVLRDPATYVYAATLTYTVNGETYRIIQPLSEEIYMSLKTTATIRYWPPNPNFAALDGTAESRDQYVGMLYQLVFPGIPATVLLVGGVIVLRRMRRTQAAQQQLEANSTLIYGQVHNVRDVPRAGREYVLRIRYTFQAPSGRLLTGEQEGPMNERRGQPLPAKGTPVAVLYTDDHFEML